MTTRNKSPVISGNEILNSLVHTTKYHHTALGGNPKRGRAEDEGDGPSRPAKNLKSDAKGKTPGAHLVRFERDF